MSCFEQCPPCEGCAAKDKEIAALVDARDRLVPRLDREIARARARAEAAEAERDAARAEHAEFLRTHHFDVFAALIADRDQLREALRKIAKLAADRKAFMLLGPRAFAQVERIARAALTPDTAKEEQEP